MGDCNQKKKRREKKRAEGLFQIKFASNRKLNF